MVKKILVLLGLISLLCAVLAGGYYIYKEGGMLVIQDMIKTAKAKNCDIQEMQGVAQGGCVMDGASGQSVPKKPDTSSFFKKFEFSKPNFKNPFHWQKGPNVNRHGKWIENPFKGIKFKTPEFKFSEFKLLKKHAKKQPKKQKFTFWTIQLKAPAGHFMDENIEAFKTLHPDIEVVWVDIPIAEAQKRTLAAVLSGNPPDLINLNPDFSSLLAQKGILEYFTDEETENLHPELINKLRYDGKIFALPFYATSPVTVMNVGVLDKCFEHGYPVITSYEDVYGVSNEIKNCTDKPAIVMNLNENDTFAKILNKYDISNFETEAEFKALNHVVRMFDDMYKKGYLPKDTLTLNHREVIEQYMAKNAAFVVAGSNFIKMIKENAPDVYKNSEISSQLTAPDGRYDVGLMNFVIPKNAKNKALAREFAFMLLNKENQLKFTKLTNTLPANLEVLLDDYFIECDEDPVEKSRCVGANQLNFLVQKDFGYKNKKAINDTLNKALEEILLNDNNSSNISDNLLEKKLEKLQNEIRTLKKD
ncbi:MAG: extracellular solute-binding protein [Candidatus Gastranaerophilales bacterium]|nr:extracellular solute-binding protein [Candidatus Gastranaerophilales bacterium]